MEPEQKLIYETYEETNQWVCSLCYPGVKEIGEIADGFWLALFEGKYMIVGYNGHRDDWAFVFEDKPTPNPDPNDEHEDNDDPILHQCIEWLDKADESYEKWLVPVAVGHDFMQSCIETGGWDQEKYKMFDQWLYDKAGRLIQEWEKNELPSVQRQPE